MRLWRWSYYLFHGRDTGVRIEFENGCFTYPEGSLPDYLRRAIEELLVASGIPRALIAVRRSNQVALYGIDDPSVAQKIRNVILT